MRKILYLLTIVVILPCFSAFCSAEEGVDEYINEFEEIIPDGINENISDGAVLQESFGFGEILAVILEEVRGEEGRISLFLFSLVGSLVLLALASSVPGSIGETASLAASCAVSVVVFCTVNGIFQEVSSVVNEANNFFLALIPITAGITALGGGVFTAEVQAAGMSLTFAAVSKLWGAAFTALSGLGLAMSLVSSFGGKGTSTVSKWVKKIFAWILGITTAVISGTFALQTMVSTVRDSAAMRAAKYTASGMIPVVGSTVSGALATLASGISYVKGIVGSGAVFVLISLLLSPLIIILLYRFALSFASFAAEFFEIGAAVRVFGAYLYSLDTVITMYSLSALIYIFQIILFVKSGVALL